MEGKIISSQYYYYGVLSGNCCHINICGAGNGQSWVGGVDRPRPKANKQLVHKPEETALETITKYAICCYAWSLWTP